MEMSAAVDAQKHFGVVYTPRPIVDLMLDVCPGKDLADVAVCDPACGDGEFLVPFAEKVCRKIKRAQKKEIQRKYYQSLHKLTGFDIDKAALDRCKERLNSVLIEHHVEPIKWNLHSVDATDPSAWRLWVEKFDYVVGNPPYVRIQHLEKSRRRKIKNGPWNFMRGACDLYLLFFDLGLRLLKTKGKLIFITPNSWLKSDSGKAFREYLRNHHRLITLFDFGQHQVFQKVTTYSSITALEKDGHSEPVVAVRKCKGIINGTPQLTPGCYLHLNDATWQTMSKSERTFIRNRSGSCRKLSDVATIHVGIQTLADSVFILPADSIDLEASAVRPIYKASVMKEGEDPVNRIIIYPYENGKLIPEDDFIVRFPKAYCWLLGHKDKLLSRDKGTFEPSKWYGFGREVSITSGFGEKILTSGMNLKPNFQYCPNADHLFYSGYCIKPHTGTDPHKLLEELNSPAMEKFICITSRPYRNGWFSYAKSFIKDYPVSEKVLVDV